MEEYCRWLLPRSLADPVLVIPLNDIRTVPQLTKSVTELEESMKSEFGKKYDPRLLLWKTIAKFMDKKALFGKLKADSRISALYQDSLNRVKVIKEEKEFYPECYDILLSLCVLYTNLDLCRKSQGTCVQAVTGKMEIQTIREWLEELAAHAKRLKKEQEHTMSRMDPDSRKIHQFPARQRLIQISTEQNTYLYMVHVLMATLTRNEEIKEEKGYVW